MTQSCAPDTAYRPEIDGLRAFAVLSVVGFHMSPNWLNGGFIGVDVFFVISGFLITHYIFQNLDKGQFSFTDFYGRRLRRIFPALILVMGCALAFGWFALLNDEYAQLGKHVASGAAFIANFVFADESGYYDTASQLKPMLHLWSLAVEEQFYILWPFVLWLAWLRKFNLLSLTIVASIASFYFTVRFSATHPIETFYWPVGRVWELLSGSILAWLVLYKREQLTALKLFIVKYIVRSIWSKDVASDGLIILNVMSVVGLCLLVYGIIFINERVVYPGIWTLIPVSGAFLVIAAGSKPWVNRVVFMNPIAVWFGLISYPLYLWHWPILSFVKIIEGDHPTRETRAAVILVSIFLAWLTYRFVEKFFRNKKNDKPKTFILIVLLVITGCVGYTISLNWLSQRDWIVNKSFSDTDAAPSWMVNDYGKVHYPFCDRFKNDGGNKCAATDLQPKTVILGDSHAGPLFWGLKPLFEDLNRGLAVTERGGCPPLYGILTKDHRGIDLMCLTYITEYIDFLKEAEFVEEVMLVDRGPLYSTTHLIGDEKMELGKLELYLADEGPNVRTPEEAFLQGLKNTLDVFTKANKRIVYVFSAPELNFNAVSCMSERYYFPSKDVRSPCTIDYSKYLKRNKPFMKIVKDVLVDYPNVRTIDLSEALCREGTCLAGENGRLYYSDDNHLNDHGAKYVVERLEDDFRNLYK